MDRAAVVVYTAQGEVEEQQVRSFLEANGIPTWVRGEALRKTHGFLLDGLGEVQILVAPAHQHDARSLLERAERGELTLSEDHAD
jgi:hypothetical protein